MPDTVYLGKTYTQNAIIEFTNGQKIMIFDRMKLCSNDMIGERKKITLETLTLLLEKSRQKKIAIIPDLDSTIQEFICRIETLISPEDPQLAQKWIDATIDFGIGKMVIDINLEKYADLDLHVGDFIHIKGRVDLIDIE